MSKEFNIIINTGSIEIGNKGYVTYHKVASIDKFKLFASRKYPQWKFATVYDKASRAKIEVIKP